MNDKNLSFITYSTLANEMNVSDEQFNQTLAEVKSEPILSIEKPQAISQIIDYPITSGKIISTKSIKDLDVTEWTLSNGTKVLYKYLPDSHNMMYFAGSAMGGNSLVKSNDIPSQKAMQALIMQSGLYKYNRNQLAEWLEGKGIQLSLSINDYTDGVGGNVNVAHADDFFQYLHLTSSSKRASTSIRTEAKRV